VSRTRQIIVLILVAFAIYAVVNSPQQSADVVGSAWDSIKSGLSSIGDFFNALLSQ